MKPKTTTRPWLILLVVVLYVLHEDFWFWSTYKPLVFGFLPIGLFYHMVYCVAAMGLFWLLIRKAWPEGLDETEDSSEQADP